MPVDLAQLLEESGAVRRGHFKLSSGRHSDVYFEKFRVLERPDVTSALCGELASQMDGLPVDLVAGPTTGGVIVAFELARHLGRPALYVESVEGEKQLRRGARVERGARVAIADDVLTTGRSLREVADLVRGLGADVVAAAVLIDRSESPVDLGCPLFAAYRVAAQSYPPDALPAWLAEIPLEQPGTRVEVG